MLKDVLSGMEVDAASHLVAQCYDGANVMAGRLNGLQALMRQKVCPMGIYVHCWAHRLNLVVVSSIQAIHKATSFFSNMSILHTFFSATVPHNYFLKAQKELGEDGIDKGKALQQHELKSLSKTRWCCQAEACDAVLATLGAILQSIEHFAEESGNADRRTAALTISGFMDTDFVVCLCIFQWLLTKAAIVSNYLQSKDLDIARAVELVKALKVDLLRYGFFDEVWEESTKLTRKFDIAPPLVRHRRRCREDANQKMWTRIDYEEQLFGRVLGVFVGELDRRFSDNVCNVLTSMSALLPQSERFLDVTLLKPFSDHYKLRSGLLKSECEVFAAQYENSSPNCRSLLDVLRLIEPHPACYSQLHTAYLIACTIPVTTAENERSFSCLKRVKTYLRSTMEDSRLGDLGTLSINRERTSKIDMEEVVDMYDRLATRKISLH